LSDLRRLLVVDGVYTDGRLSLESTIGENHLVHLIKNDWCRDATVGTVVLLAVTATAVLAACTGSGADMSTPLPEVTTTRPAEPEQISTTMPTTTTAIPGPTSTTAVGTTPTTPEPVAAEYVVDLVAAGENAEWREPDDVVRLPWGDGVGEAGYSGVFGPHSIDVLPDGSIVIVDMHNLRVELFDGGAWRILLEFEEEGDLLPYGVAAVDSGLIGVAGVPRGSAGLVSETLLLVTKDGDIVDQGRVPVIANAGWSGGEAVWSWLGPGSMPEYWIRLTAGNEVVDFDDDALDELDREIEERVARAINPYPVERMTALGYVPVRVDSGIEMQVSGGQGWDNTNPLDPFEVTVVRGGAAERWVIAGWGLEGPSAPTTWHVDQQRLVTTSFLGEELFVLNARNGGTYSAFLIARDRWVETNSWDYARVLNDRLYVLQTDPGGARIDIYDIG
jgi:hypothetical protein